MIARRCRPPSFHQGGDPVDFLHLAPPARRSFRDVESRDAHRSRLLGDPGATCLIRCIPCIPET